jgi:NAD(P)-dependent dehydrogenase (short-subunit alcohol dehydrogenase family)
MADEKTAIVTGASRGIGAGLVEAFLNEGYNAVATSRYVSQSLTASPRLVLVDGDIGKRETAAKTVEALDQSETIVGPYLDHDVRCAFQHESARCSRNPNRNTQSAFFLAHD